MAALALMAVNTEAGNNAYGPPEDDGPVVVEIGFFLTNINAINEEDETLDFEGTLSLRWRDPRLAFDPGETGYEQRYYQGYYQFDEVFSGWWPQVVLANEAGRFDREGIVVRIDPDGTVNYREEVDALAKVKMNLRRFPLDRQQFAVTFEILGYDSGQLRLRVDEGATGLWRDNLHQVQVPQWTRPELTATVLEYDPAYADGHDDPITAMQVLIDLQREPGYTLRLVALPVMIFVMLSWSVFWMERSSVGDRMDISFIGILTVVAYQIMFSEGLPKISYLTVLMAFMVISFILMCASVLINLRVAALDNSGRSMEGDRLDRRCRYLFPITYVTANLAICGTLYQIN